MVRKGSDSRDIPESPPSGLCHLLGGRGRPEHWFGNWKNPSFSLAQPLSSQVALSRHLQRVVPSSSVKVSARLCEERRG